MKNLLFIAFAITLSGCGSTKVHKKVKLAPLANEAHSEVYTKLPSN
jgi:uncharacterized lipoprotein YmbA